MEAFLVVVLGLIFFWVWRSRSSASARYQAHKDALEAGQKLVARYLGPRENAARLPFEFREHALTRLENIKCHIETTAVPAQLGNADLFQELLEDVTFVQLAASNSAPMNSFRQEHRAAVYSNAFECLALLLKEKATYDLKTFARHAEPGPDVDGIERFLPDLKEASTWFRAGDTHPALTVSPQHALEDLQRAEKAIANKHRT